MRFRRRFMPRRKAVNYRWIRTEQYVSAPGSPVVLDFLSNWRTTAGITINLPALTIWRVKLRISIIVSVTGALTSHEGVLCGIYVDNTNQQQQSILAAGGSESQQFMVYDAHYLTKFWENTDGSVGASRNYPIVLEYDIKTHRRFRADSDSLILQLAPIGNATLSNLAYQVSCLTRER